MTNAPVSVLVVDDHEMVLIGLRTLLGGVEGLRLVAQARSGEEAVAEAERHRPDVVLMDLELPDMSGVDACRQIIDRGCARHVIFLSSHSDEQSVLSTFFAGASGYLVKSIPPQSLVRSVQAVARGEPVLEPDVVRRLRSRMKGMSAPPRQAGRTLDALSAQERRILAYVVEGKTNKEIAAALSLSDKTVKNYLSNTFQKLRVNRRAEAAARYALEMKGKAG